MEAIVLAGGLGTRLQSVISEIPKPMAPIMDEPFLKYIFKYLKKNGIKKVILSVGYKWNIIKDYFNDEFDGIQIVYSVEQSPLGTGGGIYQAMKYVENDFVYIINGDTFFNVDLKKLRLSNQSMLTLSLKKMYNFDRYGTVEFDEQGYITLFEEKKYCEVGNINGGVYLASKDIFRGYNLESKFSFEEFMENNYNSLRISSQVFDGYFIDIGIPEDYEKAQLELVDNE
jgi:D-glycero-alpha-D-manno-heptose 1-phosphate guanylyltransferase